MHIETELLRVKQFLEKMDLSPLSDYLIQTEKWKDKDAIDACEQYRNFLFIKKKYGNDLELPPSVDINEVWNTHILFTRYYTQCCENIFGQYLPHHQKHATNRLDAEKILHNLFYLNTQTLYFKEFGLYITTIRKYPLLTELKRIFNKHFLRRKHHEKNTIEAERSNGCKEID